MSERDIVKDVREALVESERLRRDGVLGKIRAPSEYGRPIEIWLDELDAVLPSMQTTLEPASLLPSARYVRLHNRWRHFTFSLADFKRFVAARAALKEDK